MIGKPRRTECEFPSAPTASKRPVGKKSALVALVGSTAAAALLVLVPKEESGRTVKTEVQADGNVKATHVSGKQYLRAYKDIVGVWTICDGDTKNVGPGTVETEAGCQARLEKQLVAHAKPIIKCVPNLTKPGHEQQLIASVSLTYNIGPSGFCRSTVARRFNAGDWKGGCDAFRMWNKAGGRVVRGLAVRREREVAICMKGL